MRNSWLANYCSIVVMNIMTSPRSFNGICQVTRVMLHVSTFIMIILVGEESFHNRWQSNCITKQLQVNGCNYFTLRMNVTKIVPFRLVRYYFRYWIYCGVIPKQLQGARRIPSVVEAATSVQISLTKSCANTTYTCSFVPMNVNPKDTSTLTIIR